MPPVEPVPAPEPPEYLVVPFDGVTELRVHGVSGTPVESMLIDPHPVQVWGDKVAGFYRRPHDGNDGSEHLEAYSWGRLTSGASARAAWLLLLPFMLVNVASWAHPPRRGHRSGPVGTMSGAVRVLALSLTATTVLGGAFLGMDLLAWQCAGDVAACGGERWYTRFMTEGTFARPGVRIGVGALVPLAFVLGVRYLSRKTSKKYEDMYKEWGEGKQAPPKDDAVPCGAWDMSHPKFWRGGGPISRLRALHVAAALAIIAGLVAYATATAVPGSGDWPGAIVTIVAIAFVVAIAGLLASPLTGRRRELLEDKDPSDLYVALVSATPFAAGALLVAAVVYAVTAPDPTVANDALPGLRGAKHWLVGVQIGALVLLLVANGAALVKRDKTKPEASAGLLLGGFAAPFVALLGVVVANAFAAGLTIRTADYLGCPGPCDDKDAVAFTLSTEYLRTARGFAVAAVAALVVGGWVYFVTRRRLVKAAAANVVTEYPGHTTVERRASIAKEQGKAALTDYAAWPLALVVLTGITGGFLLVRYPGSRFDPLSLTAGSWLVGAFALGLVALGRLAYRNEGMRRTVGILWDLGTFWPRAAHPFAPPCYCERTVPELAQRITQIRGNGGAKNGAVVVSAHSQGTVIALATLLQLRREPERLGMVTYGSPLNRLYARAFPHFFGLPVLDRVRTDYGRRWVNLFRRSDPIGGPVSCADSDVAADAVRPDRRLHDPSFAMPEFSFDWPATRGHSNYFHDPAFAQTVETLANEVRAR